MFTNVYNKQRHQRTAKKCLAIQEKKTLEYNCSKCGRVFNRHDNLVAHRKICTAQPSRESDQYHLNDTANPQMVELMARMVKLLEKKDNNNNFMNLAPLTEELITKNLDRLTIDLIQEGGKGYATHAGHYPCKDNVVCTDKSRKKLHWRDENDELISDAGGVKLAQLFFKHIAQRNEELINTEYSHIQQQVQDIAIAQTAGNSNLVELLQKSTFLQDTLAKCRQAADGHENDLTKDFIRNLARML